MSKKQIPTLDCKACHKRTRTEWVAGTAVRPALPGWKGATCDQFVRYHQHLDGVCAGWAGLDRQHPLVCPNCGSEQVRPAVIIATKSDTPCRDRCVTALGPNCDCECGGENHGIYAHGKD